MSDRTGTAAADGTRGIDGGAPAARLPPNGWLPIRASWRGEALSIDWAYFGERPLRHPFFENDVNEVLLTPVNLASRPATSIELLVDAMDGETHLEPSGLIFHMSRCGSTLLSRMLAASPGHVVIAEADVIDTVVRARRPDLDQDRHARWLAAVIGALGRKRRGDQRRFFVKLDSWHTAALPLFRRAFPAVPWLFLYRDPIEILVSQLRKPGTQMLPDGDVAKLYGIERRFEPGGAEDYCARVLARIGEPVLAHHGGGGALLINYCELPDALFSRILPHFGVACSDVERAAMRAAARYDAKSPALLFAADSDAKQQAASAVARAAAARFLDELYRSLEALRTADRQ